MARRVTTTAAVAADEIPSLTTYKGFGKDWQCRGYQYALGETYKHTGSVVRCAGGGFHSCEHPLDTWNYYEPNKSRYAEVTVSGYIDRDKDGDSKIASGKITINVELSLGELTRRAVKWVAEMAKKQGNGQHTTGDRGHASAAGNYGHASAAGNYGHASAAGNYGHASAAGYRGHASAAGNYGHASAAGDGGHASAAGNYGHAEVKGVSSIAHAPGYKGKATAVAGSAISLGYYDDSVWPPKLVSVRSSMVGENGVESGKAYSLNSAGEFVEAELES